MILKKKIQYILLFLVFFYLVIELFAILTISIKYKTFVSPQQYLALLFGSSWQPENKASGTSNEAKQEAIKISYLAQLGPHPYLGYTKWLSTSPDKKGPKLGNNESFDGPDFPVVKDDSSFTILITGGSVADLLISTRNPDGSYYAENYLNEHFFPPKGKRFKIISTALGDYRLPQNIISLLIYHDILDGVIDLFGYNESHNFGAPLNKLETPSPNYWGLFDLEVKNNLSLKRAEIFNLTNETSKSWWCGYSYICMSVLREIIAEKLSGLNEVENQSSPRYLNHKLNQFRYAADFPAEKRDLQKRKKIKSYYRLFDGMCKTLEIKCSYFLQPVPQIGKILTPVEKMGLLSGSPEYDKLYESVVNNLMELKKRKNRYL